MSSARSVSTYRFQRSRRAGWRKPEGGYCVGRPGPFGNPWPVGAPGPDGTIATTRAEAVELYRRLAEHPELVALARERLAGRPLGCFCPLTEPCHADVLLEVANRAP